eukprot:gb/GEZN01002076.1/.p1 GENE.gb/GEZN01002076.1/~~gb/GEZN01002076.1/.p1  ORF type:complete len:740 (-),score=105.13 gb/GEZN01002076.1/:390-2609(-)
MSGMDYVVLEGGPGARPMALNPAPTVAGLVGMLLVGAAGWAAFQARHIQSTLHKMGAHPPNKPIRQEGAGAKSFIPKEGVDSVLVKPGSLGPLQVLPPSDSGPLALFLYNGAEPEKLKDGKISHDGWVYGAKLVPSLDPYFKNLGESGLSSKVAAPTGDPANVVKGKLLKWPNSPFKDYFDFKLKASDKFHGFKPSKPEQGYVVRRLVDVVLKDGSTQRAYMYFQNEPVIPFVPPWASWPKELPLANQKFVAAPETLFLQNQTFLTLMHKKIRDRIFKSAKSNLGEHIDKAAIVIQGGDGKQFNLYDSDCDKCVFRQEAFFHYVFGLVLPDAIGVLDLMRNEALLFVPPQDEESQRWLGIRKPMAWYTQRYLVDYTFETSEISRKLKERGIGYLHTLNGTNSDSGLSTAIPVNFKGLGDFGNVQDHLYNYLSELRVIKTPMELELMRVATKISSMAHVYVMRHIQPNMNERHLEAMFKGFTSYYGGSRHLAYTAICASGPNGAILHYGWAGNPNEKRLKDGESVVLDMGAEYHGYCTDLTRSYPVNGRFTDKQRNVYAAVLDAQTQVMNAMKPGVQWADMHRLAENIILRHLQNMGILNGTLKQLEEANLASVFMPHGLGHFIGLLTHDVGGYPPEGPPRPSRPGVKWLRTQRELKAGMVITVEPGLYFNEPLLIAALKTPAQAKYIDTKMLDGYRGSGGVRIEDDVLITETGIENLSAELPVQMEDIENLIQNKPIRL